MNASTSSPSQTSLLKLRLPALLCALAVVLCELIAHPFAEIGIADDFSYILTTQKLAQTGHLVYNGWATAMLGWQLYLGAAFVKLFGFSFSTVRMSTLFIAAVTAFLIQRTLVRCGLRELNATFGTLALVLSPLYLLLSVTFMSDIQGLFAVVICLYACIRALQAATDNASASWLSFAVLANAVCGSARQIAWLGLLVMVPSTLWLLRSRRRVLLPGIAATLTGVVFLFACLHWFSLQPYSIPEHLSFGDGQPSNIPIILLCSVMDIPFLLLPIMVSFFSELRLNNRRTLAAMSVIAIGYALWAYHWRFVRPLNLIEPTLGDWISPQGMYGNTFLRGSAPIFLHTGLRIFLTALSIGGLLCLGAAIFRNRRAASPPASPSSLSWPQLRLLLLPFTAAYCLLLVPRSAFSLFDRYLLALLLVALIFLLRFSQERLHPRLPLACLCLIALAAFYGVVSVHNMFALYRARVALVAELRSAGVPDTSIDDGPEDNGWVQLQHSPTLNDHRIVVPAHTFFPVAPPTGACPLYLYEDLPLIHPRYAISFDPAACDGPAPFAPVRYSRWIFPGNPALYAVKAGPAAR
jgi:hypothetical protein